MKHLLLTVLVFCFYFPASSQVDLNQGLIAYYSFNGTANDVSGKNNNPSYNSATLTTDRYGNANSACYFDGLDDFLTVPGTAGMNTATAMTVALYFNTESTNLQTLIGKINYANGTGAQFQVAINWTSYPGILYGVNNPADLCNTQIASNSAYVNTGGTVPTNQWHCLVCTYEGGVQKLYLNGLLVSTNNTSFNVLRQCTNSDIQIGNWWQNGQQLFKGKMDDVRIYNRALNQTEVNALCLANLTPVTASFTAPDTVCVNTPVAITNTSTNATSNYWNFCTGNLNAPPVGANLGKLSGTITSPVYIDYVEDNGNYYGFMTDNWPSRLYRLNFGNSLLNTPTITDLGTQGIPNGAEGIQVIKNEGKWYAIVVGGTLATNIQPYIIKIEFGANIANNTPTSVNWGNIGNLAYPHDLYMFVDNTGVWHGLTVNTDNSTITRFNFTNSFNNTPTAANIGNIGNLVAPTGICAINDNGNWYAFVTNANGNSLTRLDFGNSLFNTPTGTNLGNVGNVFHTPWDIQVIKYCGELIGYIVNADQSYNDIIKLNFSSITSMPTATSFGNIGNMRFPHCLSKFFRSGPDLYTFTTNVANQTITRFQFTGCTSASTPNSTSANPGPVTYNTPGTYNITLTVDDGLPTQTTVCKQVVVLPVPANTTRTITLCGGESIKIGTGAKNAQYTWNTGATTDSIVVNTSGTYWVQIDRFGCSYRETTEIITKADCHTCDSWLQLGAQPAYADAGDLDIAGNQITVEAEINRTTPYTGILYAGDVVSKHQTSSSTNYLLRPNTAEITTSTGYYRTPDICEIQLNKTYHIAMVYDGSTLKFYRDGYLMSQVAASGNLFQNNFPTRIGQYTGLGLENFEGFIDEVRIWNVARTQAEIRANMYTSLPNPTTQPGLQAYYRFDDLTNQQGNTAWNITLTGNAAIQATNTNCTFTPDSCKIAVPQFTTPDTVCVNTPVTITNTSLNATSYYWNFCVANINTPPAATNLGNPNGLLTGPVFMDYVYDNGNYYGFVVNFTQSRLVRLDYGNSLLNTPVAVNLGNYGGVLQTSGSEGIQVVQNEGKWYALIVGGSALSGTQPRIVKIDFGANITSPGTATSWGNIGNMNQPVDLHVFKEGNNWYGFTVNAEDNTIIRFNFTNSFNNTPTATNLGNVGGLQYPTGIYAINDNGFWRVFITNAGDNQRIGTNSSLTRLDFGSSLLNTPTGVNLGNPGGQLHHPRDFTIMKFCGEIVGFVVNGNPTYNDLVRLNFSNDLTLPPTATTLGNTGSLDFPHSISKLFRVNDDVYAFITNVTNSTITRLRFQGCTNASTASSTLKDPLPVTYSTPGTYNINLTIDDGLTTQASYCKQVVVLPEPPHTPTQAITICAGDNIKIGTGVKNAQYTWNTGATTDSIIVNTAGTYWVQTDRYGCTNKDSMEITVDPAPVVNLGTDASLCTAPNMVLDAGNIGATYLWQDGSTAQTFTATAYGTYYVRVTNANGCIGSDTITLSQAMVAPADFSYKQDICDPHTVVFTAAGNNPINPYWEFGDGNTTTGSLTATHTYTAYSTYTVKFGYESNGCKDTITKIISINVAWSDVIITPDTTICFNTTKQLRAQPALSFCWSPATGLNDPTTQNPVTSTTGKITYYYTAEVPGANLVQNSDFSNGNVDFISSYQYSTTGFNPAQYFVGPDPLLWHPQMAACKDHTTGTGNMLLVNGAQQINANIWSQTIAVTPNTNYAFSAWLQNISTVNPARLQFSINNVPLGNIFEANGTSCIWDQFYSSWNSGNQTTATISIVNMNQLFSGNDFALDDISFAPVYIQRDSVIISIDTPVVFTRTDTTICKDGQVQLQASGAATYSWTPAAGLSNTAIANPVATPAINTEYIVTGTNAYGCTAKDTVNINLFSIPTVMADRTLNICPGISVQLSANNTLTSWSWTPATGLSNTAISDPIATPAVNTEYTVTATTTDGCTVKDTINVNLYLLPTVITDRTLNACPETPVQLNANNTLASWSWTPAAGLSSTTINNPVATPAANTEYIVNGTTVNGCIVKDTIDINLYLLPAVITDRIVNICPNTSIQLSANNSLTAWSWSPATGLNSTTISNPVAKPAVDTAYMVTARTSDGCTVKDTIDIKLYPVPTVITDHDITACPNVPLQLSANNNMTSWSWTPALYLSNPAIANPTATPAKSLTYTVQVKDPNNCVYSDTVNIQVLDTRFALFVSNRSICQGSPAPLTVLGGDSWLWSPAGSLSDATIANPVATPDTTTLYTVTAKESTCGKDSTMYVQVNVSPVPVIAVTKENDLNCVVHTTRLHVSGTPGTSYLWSPVTGLDHPNLPDPVSAPDTTTRYYVTGSNKYGCTVVDSVTVYVEAEGKVTFMVPNAFTPNNDGRNDCFGVKSWGGATIEEFSVFNRWGQRVFSSKNATACWNGRFNGELQPSGAYVYVITAKTFCGRIKRTGTVMLVR